MDSQISTHITIESEIDYNARQWRDILTSSSMFWITSVRIGERYRGTVPSVVGNKALSHILMIKCENQWKDKSALKPTVFRWCRFCFPLFYMFCRTTSQEYIFRKQSKTKYVFPRKPLGIKGRPRRADEHGKLGGGTLQSNLFPFRRAICGTWKHDCILCWAISGTSAEQNNLPFRKASQWVYGCTRQKRFLAVKEFKGKRPAQKGSNRNTDIMLFEHRFLPLRADVLR